MKKIVIAIQAALLIAFSSPGLALEKKGDAFILVLSEKGDAFILGLKGVNHATEGEGVGAKLSAPCSAART